MSFEDPVRIPEGVALVMIGRNEGERLERSLRRLDNPVCAVYVDSGSTDGSADRSRGLGIHTLVLDDSVPHTAARGRNAGFAYALEKWPETRYVFFHDSDCLLDSEWMFRGQEALDQDSNVAVVSGIQRELHPDATIYNRLMELEWQQPFGDVPTVIGNAMIRVEAFQQAGGFRMDLVAGEEADLHRRIRATGQKVRRLEVPMTCHDAEMTRFQQWWKRHIRSGHAVSEGARLHGEPHELKSERSNFFWGAVLPAVGVLGAPVTLGLSSAMMLAGYPVLYGRVLMNETKRGRSLSDAELYARYAVLSKFPQALGQCKYYYNRMRGEKTDTIDYRDAGAKPKK